MKRFNEKEPVSIHNEYPRRLYPIKYGAKVYALLRGTVYSGKVVWYHPSRECDASCIITPGHPFYRIQFGKGVVPFGYDNVGAEHVRPATRRGMRELERVLIEMCEKHQIETQQKLLELTKHTHILRSAWCRKWKRKWTN